VGAGLSGEDALGLAALRASDGAASLAAELRVDLGAAMDAVLWLNDLEADAAYRRLSPRLGDVLMAMPGARAARRTFSSLLSLLPFPPLFLF